jgi:hypothetical protein
MLEQILRKELLAIPAEHWSHYFPAQVAILRFLAERYEGKVELTAAGFNREGPYVRGKGIGWFADVLWQQEDVLELVDRVMTNVVVDLKQRPASELDNLSHVVLDSDLVAQLERQIIEKADKAISEGAL